MRFGKFDVRYLGAVAALGMVVLIAVSQGQHRGDNWWAAWGSWIGGFGSITAAGAAVWIAIEGWRRTEKQLQRAEEREYATKFLVWIEHVSQSEYRVVYMNSGPLPVFNVQVVIYYNDNPIGDFPMTDLRPVTTPTAREPATAHVAFWVEKEVERQAGHPFVGPDRVIGTDEAKPRQADVAALRRITKEIRFAITFEDGNRARWERTHAGELRRIPR
ncbi:hypothetical protein AB0C38_31785 [Amycolatopsis sp. NPDC048633]|uniref:hypothetical protein n=1 Tax=Amycolatopsis sp. NPDC048633 TaxID=3157095 RepID=UPI00340C2199